MEKKKSFWKGIGSDGRKGAFLKATVDINFMAIIKAMLSKLWNAFAPHTSSPLLLYCEERNTFLDELNNNEKCV